MKIGTLQWVHRFNHLRVLEPTGDMPTAITVQIYYPQRTQAVAILKQPSLGKMRGGLEHHVEKPERATCERPSRRNSGSRRRDDSARLDNIDEAGSIGMSDIPTRRKGRSIVYPRRFTIVGHALSCRIQRCET